MLLNKDVLPIIIAGLMNGSFVVPAKYTKFFSNEKIWFYYSIIGIFLVPWIILFFTAPSALNSYFSLSYTIILFLLFSGFIFGLGQVCFSYAIERIGIALSFTINLGLGVVIGSMFVVFYKQEFFSSQGYLVTFSVLLIILGLLINYLAGVYNQQANTLQHTHNHYHIGWLLAILTGITSGLQNITFVTVAFHSTLSLRHLNPFWVWPPFLLAASVPMVLGFIYRIKRTQKKQQGFVNVFLWLKNITLITLMGLFFTGSLSLYSTGMKYLSHQEQIIGWPVFMVVIILSSQFWGWLYKEGSKTHGANNKKYYKFISITLLISAIILLSIDS